MLALGECRVFGKDRRVDRTADCSKEQSGQNAEKNEEKNGGNLATPALILCCAPGCGVGCGSESEFVGHWSVWGLGVSYVQKNRTNGQKVTLRYGNALNSG
jgi:hypothetical protein